MHAILSKVLYTIHTEDKTSVYYLLSLHSDGSGVRGRRGVGGGERE